MSESFPKKTHFEHFRHEFHQILNPKVAAIKLRNVYDYEETDVS